MTIEEWAKGFKSYVKALDMQRDDYKGIMEYIDEGAALLKEQEAVEPKTITEELKQKMWNALYAEEDAFEEKYVRTKKHERWFLIYRPWLQEGFNLAIKAIEDWGRSVK